MKFSLAALFLAPLALAFDSQPLPQGEVTDNSVAAGLVSSDAPKVDGLNAVAACPINYPYLCPNGLCCPYSTCCSLECCSPLATYCSNGRCYR